MLTRGGRKAIGFWRRGLLTSKAFLPNGFRNWLADRWLERAHQHVNKAKALSDAASEIEPTPTPTTTSGNTKAGSDR